MLYHRCRFEYGQICSYQCQVVAELSLPIFLMTSNHLVIFTAGSIACEINEQHLYLLNPEHHITELRIRPIEYKSLQLIDCVWKFKV